MNSRPNSFTQWSGNTLISYYLGTILRMIGMNDTQDMQRINLGIASWSLICGFTVAMLVRRFRRRVMYMTCTIALLSGKCRHPPLRPFTLPLLTRWSCLVYIAWTISMERAMHAADNDYVNRVCCLDNHPYTLLLPPPTPRVSKVLT